MPLSTTRAGKAAATAWLPYATLGALLTAWGGFWLLVFVHSPAARMSGLWCGALSFCGLVLSALGLILRPSADARPAPRSGPGCDASHRLGPDRRLDRVRQADGRARRPHLWSRGCD